MPRRFTAFGWSIDLAPEWRAEIRHESAFGETTGFVAIVPRTEDALLRLTLDERGIMAAAKWVEVVGQTNRIKGRPVSTVRCGDFSGNAVEFKSGDEWIRGWALCFGSCPFDATYRCNASEMGRDDPMVDKMLSTLRIETSARG